MFRTMVLCFVVLLAIVSPARAQTKGSQTEVSPAVGEDLGVNWAKDAETPKAKVLSLLERPGTLGSILGQLLILVAIWKAFKYWRARLRAKDNGVSASMYATYADVPCYRRQWFFWLTWFFLQAVAIGLLVTGDVYYVKRNEVRSFGKANRIVAGIIALYLLVSVLIYLISGRTR
jgi:hypothetical protein